MRKFGGFTVLLSLTWLGCGDSNHECDAADIDAIDVDAPIDASIDAAPPETAFSLRFGGIWNDIPFGLDATSGGTFWISGAMCSPDVTEDVTGCFINLGGGELTVSNGDSGQDVFAAHLSADGSHQFSQAYTTTFGPTSTDLVVDSQSQVTMTGATFGGMDFGGGAMASGVYLASVNSTGVEQWSGGFGAFGTSKLATDAANNVYVVGSYGLLPNLNFNPGTPGDAMNPVGGLDIYVAKLDNTGAFQWQTSFGSTGGDGNYSDGARAVAVEAGTANVFVTGFFGVDGGSNPDASIDFGLGALTASGDSEDIFLVKLNANGTSAIWSFRFGGTDSDNSNAVIVDGNGDVIIAGQFKDTINFGGGTLTSAGEFDAFVAKFDGATGAHIWSTRFGGTGVDQAVSLALTANNGVLVGGDFSGDVDFGGGVISSVADSFDVFLVHLDSSGAHTWSQGYGGADVDTMESVAVDSDGNYLAAGSFEGTSSFGSGMHTSAGNKDIFVFKVDPAP